MKEDDNRHQFGKYKWNYFKKIWSDFLQLSLFSFKTIGSKNFRFSLIHLQNMNNSNLNNNSSLVEHGLVKNDYLKMTKRSQSDDFDCSHYHLLHFFYQQKIVLSGYLSFAILYLGSTCRFTECAFLSPLL